MTTLHFVLWFACFSYTGANYSTPFRPLSPMDYFVGSENTLFFVRPEALLNISKEESSLNLRTFLTSKYASGHAFTTKVCWSYNSNKAICDMQELYLLRNKTIMPQRLLQNITVEETRLPICDVGTGNSGCSSPMYLVSPCGTLENKHTPDCFWVLTVQDSSVIVLNIEVFEIRYSGEQCVMDHLLITEQKDTENGTTKTQLGRFCGHREKWVLVSSTNNITIQLVTHLPKTSKNSMKIAYQAMDKGNRTIENRRLLLLPQAEWSMEHKENISSNLGEEYLRHTFIWIIRVPIGRRINLTAEFTKDLAWNATDCEVSIHEGPSENLNDLGVQGNIGNQNQLSITFDSLGFLLMVKLRTNSYMNISVSCMFWIKSYEPLSNNIGGTCNTFPNGSVYLGKSTNVNLAVNQLKDSALTYCSWRFLGSELITLKDMKVHFPGPNVNNCQYSGLTVYDGNDTTANIIGPICGTISDRIFLDNHRLLHGSGRSMMVVFHAYRILAFGKYASFHSSVCTLGCSGHTLMSLLSSRNRDFSVEFTNSSTVNISLKRNISKCLLLIHPPTKQALNMDIVINFPGSFLRGSPIFFSQFIGEVYRHSPVCLRERLSYYFSTKKETRFVAYDRNNTYFLGHGMAFTYSTLNCSWLIGGFSFIYSDSRRVGLDSFVKHFTQTGNLFVRQGNEEIYIRAPPNLSNSGFYNIIFDSPTRLKRGGILIINVIEEYGPPCIREGKPGPRPRQYEITARRLPYRWKTFYSGQVAIQIKTILDKQLHVSIAYELKGYKLPRANVSLVEHPQIISPLGHSGSKLVCYGDFCYQLFEGSQNSTWSSTEKACRHLGGNLLSITSKDEMALIRYFQRILWQYHPENDCIFIGLRYNKTVSNYILKNSLSL